MAKTSLFVNWRYVSAVFNAETRLFAGRAMNSAVKSPDTRLHVHQAGAAAAVAAALNRACGPRRAPQGPPHAVQLRFCVTARWSVTRCAVLSTMFRFASRFQAYTLFYMTRRLIMSSKCRVASASSMMVPLTFQSRPIASKGLPLRRALRSSFLPAKGHSRRRNSGGAAGSRGNCIAGCGPNLSCDSAEGHGNRPS